jgi:hypothetical protein
VPAASAFAVLLVGGALLAALSAFALRRGDAHPGLARRLAGPREVKVGALLSGPSPERAVRVTGRIRCADPLVTEDGERLVAFHRDVEVRIGGRWRSVERLRETRSFDLWDHDGSLSLDPARAAEPLVTIPKVWRGDPADLEEPHASAAARLAERHGPIAEARAATRTVSVVDRLLVVARPVAEDGGVRLEPPPGGYVISNLVLGDAMRILGGRSRKVAAAGTLGVGVGVALAAIGLVGAVAATVLGA